MSRPSTSSIKDAYTNLAWAMACVDALKKKVVDLHYASEHVDNMEYLVENHHRFAAPDADSHDVLFARQEEAKVKLAEVYGSLDRNSIIHQIDEAIESLNKAKESL